MSKNSKHRKPEGGAGKGAKTRRGSRPRGGQGANAARSSRSRSGSSRNDRAGGRASRAGCALCPVFGTCGGCETLDVAYEEQLARKQAFIADLFSGFSGEGGSQAAESGQGPLRPILGMSDPFHYRNKVISPYAFGRVIAQQNVRGREKRGGKAPQRREILTGMYAKGTHRLVPTDRCMLENETAKQVTLAVRDLMRRWDIEPYDEDASTGFLRHAVVRVGHESAEVLVTLVTNGSEFPSSKSFCRELVKRVPAVTTVVQNVNTRQTNVILGDEERTLYGPGFILDRLCGLSFRISSRSFYQVNSTQTEVLYNKAIELADLSGTETVIDAYCGTGTIGLVAAARGASRVIGVDNVESAIRDARENARHNGIGNAEFQAVDAGAFMQRLAASRRQAAEGAGEGGAQAPGDLVLMMDPPRAGSTESFLAAAVELSPSRIVYISCNPKTQARDAAYLVRAGYRIDAIQPVDMFPHTNHVECICRFVLDDAATFEKGSAQ